MRTVKVGLYGRLRDAGLGEAVELDVEPGQTAAELLEILKARLGPVAALAAGAVVATDDEVLPASSRLPESGGLSVLPPVCGG